MNEVQTLTISHMGHHGDGLSSIDGKRIDIPFVLPGERVRVEITRDKEHIHGRVLDIIQPSTDRVVPPCPVFGSCGGCRLQHMRDAPYREWKLGVINHLLEKHGFDIRAHKQFVTPPATRRRVTFTALKSTDTVDLGYHMRENHHLVNINACAILRPELAALIEPLRQLLNDVLADGQRLRLHATILNGKTGLVLEGVTFGAAHISHIIKWGVAHRLACIYSKADDHTPLLVLLEQSTLMAQYGATEVKLPPAAFMQASDEAERAMLAVIKPFFASSKKIADLFCGTGLFSLNVHDTSKTVLAVDVDGEAIDALHAATKNLRGFKTLRRNLFRDPLNAIELKAMDGICLDPPRAGAKEQCIEIARSHAQAIAYVSCNPVTFMRDAHLMIKGGYRLTQIHVFDQFLWSHHIELIGLFRR